MSHCCCTPPNNFKSSLSSFTSSRISGSSSDVFVVVMGIVFNLQVVLRLFGSGDGMEGIVKQSQIGFLTIMEYNDYVRVGNNLKNPKYPIWIVNFESHYSVLFEFDSNEFFYYDQLMRQESDIHLTISNPTTKSGGGGGGDIPLENVMSTKWKNVSIDWNGVEPLL